MKGLLLKDLYIVRDGALMLAFTFIAVGAGMAFLISPWVLTVITATTLSLQAAATIQYDRTSQWDRFSVTLPVPRSQVAASKYLLYLLLCGAGVVLGILICLVISIFRQSFDPNALFMYTCLAVTVSLLPGSMSIPCAFFLDEEKSIVGTVLSYMVTAGLFAGLIVLLSRSMDTKDSIGGICGVTAAVSVAAFLLSWAVCPERIARKDL